MQHTRTMFGVLILTALSQAATVSHIYELNGNLADSLGGPAMVSAGGLLGASGYTFDYNQGPNVSNAINATNYSIEILFTLNEVSGYNRVLDFKNRTTDVGVYVYNGGVQFWNITGNGPTPLAADQTAHFVLTRNSADNVVTGYLQGVQQFSFIDSGSAGVFSGANNIIHILRDEGGQGVPGEHSAGFLDRVRIYEGALTSGEVVALFNGGTPPGFSQVPEPSSWALLSSGLLAGFALRRNRRA